MGSQSSSESLIFTWYENASFFPSKGRTTSLPFPSQSKPHCWAAWGGTWTGHTDAKLLGRADEWSRTAVSSQWHSRKPWSRSTESYRYVTGSDVHPAEDQTPAPDPTWWALRQRISHSASPACKCLGDHA
ncbi:hypothetical protein Landi51_01325 [Colletotrichum acutatum]